jgi:hypothetical protein
VTLRLSRAAGLAAAALRSTAVLTEPERRLPEIRRIVSGTPMGQSMYAWQFAKAQSVAVLRFVSMQNHYNLVHREEEREMIPHYFPFSAQLPGSAHEQPPAEHP